MSAPYYEADGIAIHRGDALAVLRTLPHAMVQCCVTSPPYWGLRDYGVAGQLGLEETPEEYVANIVSVFREVRRVLRDDGTLWLNLGDSYAAGGHGGGGSFMEMRGGDGSDASGAWSHRKDKKGWRSAPDGLKPKDLVGIPWRVAFALQADGWYLRSDIIWSKPNPMPESVTDRPTKSHEYLFLLSKSERYYYDADAVAEPIADASIARLSQDVESQYGSNRVPGKTNGPMKAVARRSGNTERKLGGERGRPGSHLGGSIPWEGTRRNRRTVWTVATQPYSEAHFATFPPKLIEPCILAGAKPGDTVLDPFSGAGTTGLVAQEHNRRFVGIELNPAYIDLTAKRLAQGVLDFGGVA